MINDVRPIAPHATPLRICTAILLLALHAVLVLRSYPPSLLLHGELPLKGDVGRYFATAAGAAGAGGLYGYDPHFMAGYPVGLWNSMGKKRFRTRPSRAAVGAAAVRTFDIIAGTRP